MKISRIEHLGIAVKSIEEALPYYEQVLGFECYNIETVEDQKVRTAFLKVGETKIELLEATSPESTIAKFIENRGEGIHHIASRLRMALPTLLPSVRRKRYAPLTRLRAPVPRGCRLLSCTPNRQRVFLPNFARSK